MRGFGPEPEATKIILFYKNPRHPSCLVYKPSLHNIRLFHSSSKLGFVCLFFPLAESKTLTMATQAIVESVQCFGRKKTAVAVTHCKRGRGLIKINGCPIELVEPEILRFKAYEPILLLGRHRFAGVDMRIRVKGGGHTSQIYAIRQSIAKALVAFYQKFVDEQQKKEIKDILVSYDRTLLVADPRRCEPKKFGGRGARARFQKSYR